jgi:hypothetical protein
MFLSFYQQTFTNGKAEFDLRSGYFPAISVLVLVFVFSLVLISMSCNQSFMDREIFITAHVCSSLCCSTPKVIYGGMN